MSSHKIITIILLILAICLGGAVLVQNRKMNETIVPPPNNTSSTSTSAVSTTTVATTTPIISGTTTKPTPQPPVPSPSTAQKFPKQIALSLSRPYMFPNGAVLRVKQIVSDSRCASDVQCIWAGNVIVKFTINYKEFELTYTPGGIKTSYPYGGYTIFLTEVQPERGTQSKNLTLADYVFVMDVVK